MATDTTVKLVTAITNELYGAAVAGMTTKERVAYHFRQSTKRHAEAILRRERVAAAISTEEQARVDKEAAYETERQARLTAEADADVAAKTLLDGVT